MGYLDQDVKEALKKAQKFAKHDKDTTVRPSHLLHAILSERENNPVIIALDEMKILEVVSDIYPEIRKGNIVLQEKTLKTVPQHPTVKACLKFAKANTRIMELKDMTSLVDLMVALLSIDNELTKMFEDCSVNLQRFQQIAYIAEDEYFFEHAEFLEEEQLVILSEPMVSKVKQSPFIAKFCKDLNKMAMEGKLDPVVGRDDELMQLVRVISRRRKKNAVVVGPAGVGKTALIEGLATGIVNRTVPKSLWSKKIYILDITSLISGTKYRGQFEERVKGIVDELEQYPDLILFIDEFHTMVGAGNSEGSLDLANVLKPPLARGNIQVLGSTTLEEYKLHIEPDKALQRRFEVIRLEEPDEESCLKILKRVAPIYEKEHGVLYPEETLKACIELSKKYMTSRFLPDKAIDLLDDAGAKSKTTSVASPKIRELKKELKELDVIKLEVIKNRKFDLAENLIKETKKLEQQIKKEKSRIKNEDPNKGSAVISENDIKILITEITGIPLRVTEEEVNVLDLAKTLKNHVIGQNDAIDQLVKTLAINQLGLDNPDKPIGSFIFLGYSGVGKTELTKGVAKTLFGDEKALVRIDCSEYSQRHSVSNLIGSPAGYVGYKKGGQLTEKVKNRPYCVILWDEIEKGHPALFDILLQLLDEGRLTDNKGNTVDFKNCLNIFTSNIGMRKVMDAGSPIGFTANQTDKTASIIEKELHKKFRPEFINRLDSVIMFNTLSKDNLKDILDIRLASFVKAVEKKGFSLDIKPSVKTLLVNEGYNPKMGFRPVERQLNDKIKYPLAQAILGKKFKQGDTLVMRVKNKKVIIEEKVKTLS